VDDDLQFDFDLDFDFKFVVVIVQLDFVIHLNLDFHFFQLHHNLVVEFVIIQLVVEFVVVFDQFVNFDEHQLIVVNVNVVLLDRNRLMRKVEWC